MRRADDDERFERVSPEVVHHVTDEACGLSAYVVLDDRTLGPAFGGIRFRGYDSDVQALADACGLARQMTLKCAFAELDAGGGKAVVRTDGLVDRRRACEVLGDFIESLRGAFRTAGDFGATRRDLEILAARTSFIVDPGDVDALGDAVSIGIVAAIEALLPRLGVSQLADLRILVQGLGEIGAPLVRRLAAAGVRPLVAEIDKAALAWVQAELDVEVVPPAAALEAEVDVFSPCAVGGLIGVEAAAAIPARAIVGGANRVLADDAAGDVLWRRGVLYVPDFVVNAGAVIRGATAMLRGVPAREDEVARIGGRVARLFDEAERRDREPAGLAREWACERVARARR